MNSEKPVETGKHSKRFYALWGTVVVLLLASGLFCWLVVVPVIQVRAIVEEYNCETISDGAAIKRMGGLESAADALYLYLRLPHRLGPHRASALWLLGCCGDKASKALPQITELFTHEDHKVRRAAAWALGRTGDPRAVDPLLAGLKDQEFLVFWGICQALGRIADPRAVKPLVAVFPKQSVWEVQTALTAIGEPAVDTLIAALEDQDYGVRYGAAGALMAIGDRRSVMPFCSVLKDKEWNIRGIAAQALAKMPDPRAVGPLIACLQDKKNPVHMAAAAALGEIGDTRATEPLIAALKNKDPFVREKVARALGKLGDTRAIKPLIGILGLGYNWDSYRTAADALAKLGEPAVVPLITALKDGDARPHQWHQAHVREYAAHALGLLGDARAIDPLTAALKDKSERVRETACLALDLTRGALFSKKGDHLKAIEPLLKVIKSRKEWARNAAANRLAEIGESAIESLIGVLEHKDWWVSCSAIQALGKIKNTQAMDALIKALKNKQWLVREAAVKALGERGNPQSVRYLMEVLDDPDARIREATIRALGRIGTSRAVEALIPVLDAENSSERKAAVVALGKTGNPQAIKPLEAALDDGSFYVHLAARKALKNIRKSMHRENPGTH